MKYKYHDITFEVLYFAFGITSFILSTYVIYRFIEFKSERNFATRLILLIITAHLVWSIT